MTIFSALLLRSLALKLVQRKGTSPELGDLTFVVEMLDSKVFYSKFSFNVILINTKVTV